MIRHLLKLVWRRKGINLLVMAEIFICFAIVFVLATAAFQLRLHFGRPLGFSSANVWAVQVLNLGQRGTGESQRVYALLRELPEIEAVSVAQAPYSHPHGELSQWMDRRLVSVHTLDADDALPAVLGLRLVRGRWFDRTDDGLGKQAVVVTEDAARAAFGEADPIGQCYGGPKGDCQRVVGVLGEFRMLGQLDPRIPLLISRVPPEKSTSGEFVIKVRPGTSLAFEERLLKRVRQIDKDRLCWVTPLTTRREMYFQKKLATVVIGGIVAAFMLVMVALGLTGVLWQSVTRRTREIGLRRAQGATAGAVRRQILGELLLLALLAVAPGILIAIQAPWLWPLAAIEPLAYLSGLASASVFIVALVMLCGLYPSHAATRIQPAEALRHE